MHDLDVIHLDLKPDNLLFKNVNGYPHLQIADFGFARQFNDDTNRGLTIEIKNVDASDDNKSFYMSRSMSGGVGTTNYNSPEIHEK